MNGGGDIIALAGALSITLSENADMDELITLIEFMGLMRHNLEVIRFRRIAQKIERKIEHKQESKEG